MSLTLAVMCRRSLPPSEDGVRLKRELSWAEDEEVGVDVYELAPDPERDAANQARVGFRPAVHLVLAPHWEASMAVAIAVAEAFDGVVVLEYDRSVVAPTKKRTTPTTRAELDALLDAVFEEAVGEWAAEEERQAAEAKAVFERAAEAEPEAVKDANDWSDL